MTAPSLKGGRAVTEQCGGDVVEGDTPEMALFRRLNFFATAPWAARAVAEIVLEIDPPPPGLRWRVHEPACGQGHMAWTLAESFDVSAADIHPFGFGDVNDYLASGWVGDQVDWTITNPPFKHAQAFIEAGLARSRRGVAMLCRSNFRETAGRRDLMAARAFEAPFCERLEMQLGPWNPKGSGQVAFSWFVWMKPQAEASSPFGALFAQAREAGFRLDRPIPPGAKARLRRRADVERFAARADAPLFESQTPAAKETTL